MSHASGHGITGEVAGGHHRIRILLRIHQVEHYLRSETCNVQNDLDYILDAIVAFIQMLFGTTRKIDIAQSLQFTIRSSVHTPISRFLHVDKQKRAKARKVERVAYDEEYGPRNECELHNLLEDVHQARDNHSSYLFTSDRSTALGVEKRTQ